MKKCKDCKWFIKDVGIHTCYQSGEPLKWTGDIEACTKYYKRRWWKVWAEK